MNNLVTQANVPFADIERMAEAMAASGFFGFKTKEQALAVMLIAHANGQHPATAAQDYDVIQNKPAKKPQAMLRDFLANGGRVEWHESSDSAAEATFSHPAGGAIKVRWDMARANKMGLGGKDNYKKQAGVMFRWRCVSEGVRIVFPAATGGLYSPDEVAEIVQAEPETKNVTPRKEDAAKLPPPAKPMYPEDQFEKNLFTWSDMIASGDKKADGVITTVESKYIMTEEQKKKLRDIKVNQPEGETA